MFKKINWFNTFFYAAIASVAFIVPAYFYIRNENYASSWLLFLGSALFFFVTALHTYRESSLRGGNESTVALVFASHVTTLVGIVFSCALSFALMSLMIPGYLQSGNTDDKLNAAPPNTIFDKTNGLSFKLFMAAIIVNFAGGSMAGITIPFYSKRNQTKDRKEPQPLHQTKFS